MRNRLSLFQMIVSMMLLATSQACWMPQLSLAATSEIAHSTQTPSLQDLEQGIADRLKRVEEFRFIEQEAAKLGVRAWLFGGTAAGYAHYVKWDMQREKGDTRFQQDRFDYDYTNIYRSTQDLDIVIDGNADQAQKLQTALQEKYPHLQGSKTAWEVRLLTQDMGDKLAILKNPDFLNQHSDSNSTGLIEITKPQAGESVVRDVRDWNSKEPFFLKDVHDGMLHYYFSPSHGSTKFAKEGRNPPILSVIRFLTKAFQYELEIRPEDLKHLKKVIDGFNPQKGTKNSYVANWIEKNGKKLIQNAVNIEYAWDTLEGLGLRQKLIRINDNAGDTDSLAWWMNKEPLRTKPLGKGFRKTAQELGIDVVAHETNNFLAYESITKAHTGDPNVLISRKNNPGEVAAYGNGFYARVGREGARGTGLTIRFHLDPDARQGADFDYLKEHDYVVVKNKAALRVIPESLSIGPVEYFRILAGDSFGFGFGDRGIIEKFKRRIGNKMLALDERQLNEIFEVVQTKIKNASGVDIMSSRLLAEWSALPGSENYPDMIHLLRSKGIEDGWIAERILSLPHWLKQDEWVEEWGARFVRDQQRDERVARYIVSHPIIQKHPDWIRSAIRYSQLHPDIAKRILSQPDTKEHPEWVRTILNEGNADVELAKYVLTQPHWKDHPEWVIELAAKEGVDVNVRRTLFGGVIGQPHETPQSRFIVESLLKKGTVDPYIAAYVLSQPFSKDHPEWVETLLKRGSADEEIARFALSKPHWKDHPEFVSKLIDKLESWDFRNNLSPAIAKYVLAQPHWKDHPEFVESLIKKGAASLAITQYVLTQPHWNYRQDWAFMVLDDAEVFNSLYRSPSTGNWSLYDLFGHQILSEPQWMDQPEFIEKVLKKRGTWSKRGLWSLVAHYTLSQPHAKNHPEFIPLLIKAIESDGSENVLESVKRIDNEVFSLPHWKDHPELRKLTGGLVPTYQRLKTGIERAEQGKGPAFSIRGCIYNMLKKNLASEPSP